METFTNLKNFVDQRKKYLSKLDIESIDAPIVELISGFAKLDYCFTLQSCYGHFLHNSQKNPYNIEPLPTSKSIPNVEYKIAYSTIYFLTIDLQHLPSQQKTIFLH